MKVMVISTPVFKLGERGLGGYGGLEQIAWLTAKGLAEKGHQVWLVAPDESVCPGVHVIHTGPAQQHNEPMAYNIYWKKLLEMDVVLDHSWQKMSYQLKEEGKLKVPVLGVCHAPVNTMMQNPPPVDKGCMVCISEDQAAHYRGLFSKDARVCYNGIDLEHYKPLNIPRTDRFLFLARFSSVKSPDIAQDVCQAANVGLDLIGDTSITNEPDYLMRCMQKADGTLIRMLGACSRGETVYYYSRSRAFIHLNKNFREPFGLAPLEAQLCGLPVLAWNNGAMRETVEHGKTGYLVTSEREAVEVLKSGVLDNMDRSYCREWASQFSVQRMVSRYEELCQEALNTGGW